MTRRTKAMLRAMGREDFEASLRETATDGHALALTVLFAAGRDDLTDAELGAFVRGAVAAYPNDDDRG